MSMNRAQYSGGKEYVKQLEATATRLRELLRKIETLVNEEQFDMGHRNWELHVVNNIREILAKELADE